MDYIPKDQLEVGADYECEARNFTEGTWDGGRFRYVRFKFGDTYADYEYHWDDGAPYGTVKPLKRL